MPNHIGVRQLEKTICLVSTCKKPYEDHSRKDLIRCMFSSQLAYSKVMEFIKKAKADAEKSEEEKKKTINSKEPVE